MKMPVETLSTELALNEDEKLRGVVKTYEVVARFLRGLTDQISTEGLNGDLVRSTVVVRLFLESQAKSARAGRPEAFTQEVTSANNEGTETQAS